MKHKTWDKNPIAKKIKQDNLVRTMGTDESVEMVKDSLCKCDLCFIEEDWLIPTWLFVSVLLILGLALGILFAHFLVVMPNLS